MKNTHLAPDGLTLLLRPREAASAMRISERHLWNLTRRGEIRAIRMGRARAYSVDELRAFVARKIGGTDVEQ